MSQPELCLENLSILSISDRKEVSIRVTSTEFQQNVGRYQDAAQQAAVCITKNGRTHTVLMSASLFETVMKGRVARKVEDLDDETLQAIAASSVADEFADLDNLIQDWKP